MALSWFGNADPIDSIGILTAVARRFRSMPPATFDIAPTLLRRIAKDIGLSVDEFVRSDA